jgi:hypothetical protein
MRRMTEEEKFEWLWDNWINGNRRDARELMKEQSKEFVVKFILYVATHSASTEDKWHEAVTMAWEMVRRD